jgi:23S rRNA (cytidine1920-2'-O)/16S rRNA (cytidine1409-2'-O)-methyltransferase
MQIEYNAVHPYVSRGGVKLAAALDRFSLSPANRVCLDVGSSTGGFAQVLLERGARRVYCVDVGHGQFHPKLVKTGRVVLHEGVDARSLTSVQIPERPQAVTADVSFISLRQALAPALSLAEPDAWAVLLVKPQFESGPHAVSSGGVVRDSAIREKAVSDVTDWFIGQGWERLGELESPITGKEGNREYLVAGRKSP